MCYCCFSYRTTEEVKKVRKERDPLKIAAQYITKYDVATEEEMKKMRKEIEADMKKDVEFALTSQELPLEELYTDIHTNTPVHLVRGCDPFTWGKSQIAA